MIYGNTGKIDLRGNFGAFTGISRARPAVAWSAIIKSGAGSSAVCATVSSKSEAPGGGYAELWRGRGYSRHHPQKQKALFSADITDEKEKKESEGDELPYMKRT